MKDEEKLELAELLLKPSGELQLEELKRVSQSVLRSKPFYEVVERINKVATNGKESRVKGDILTLMRFMMEPTEGDLEKFIKSIRRSSNGKC
jgi:hypothetical protein